MLQTYVGCGLGRGLFAGQGRGPLSHTLPTENPASPILSSLVHTAPSPGSYHFSVLPHSLTVLSNCQDSFPTSAACGTWAAFLLVS